MKKVNIIYWVFTILLAVAMLFSAIGGLMPNAEGEAMMKHIGYGPHVLPLLSILKILGVIALLVPRFPRLKEWAYAGFTFDLIGAVYSFVAVGDPVKNWAPILLGFVFILVSYVYWHKKLKLQAQLNGKYDTSS
ncbi:DoxX family protein [Mucilaginibacter sp. PAMB04168]|uniref:DoxX family protein n=1 Tax=Mucilaginibacter sp. PAMB04168 TaxID=3138567 RepID=UPI0031F70AEA